MSGTQSRSKTATSAPNAPTFDMKLEVVVIPVGRSRRGNL